MADYIPITDNELLPDQPISSLLGLRWRDNPLAIAEGAPGAPRVMPRALSSNFLASLVSVTATTARGVYDIGWLRSFRASIVNAAASVTNVISISYSSDNGVTWGPWLTIGQLGTSIATTFLELDIRTGECSWTGLATPLTLSPAPVGTNAMRFLNTGSGNRTTFTLFITTTGGI